MLLIGQLEIIMENLWKDKHTYLVQYRGRGRTAFVRGPVSYL